MLLRSALLVVALLLSGCANKEVASTETSGVGPLISQKPNSTHSQRVTPMSPDSAKPLPAQAVVRTRPERQVLLASPAGNLLDQQDYLLALAAERSALMEGRSTWQNTDSGRSGEVTRGASFQAETFKCHDYIHMVVSGAQRIEIKRSACNVNGNWEVR